MDDYRYFGRAVKPLRTPFTVDKDKILALTSQLLEREILHETLQETFGAYVEACMEYTLRREAPTPCVKAPYPCDDLLLPAKKISSFVTKKNVPHYAKAQDKAEAPDPSSSTHTPTGEMLPTHAEPAGMPRPSDDPKHGGRLEPAAPVRPRVRRPTRLPKTQNDAVPKPRRAVLIDSTLELG